MPVVATHRIDCIHLCEGDRCGHPEMQRKGISSDLFGAAPACVLVTDAVCPYVRPGPPRDPKKEIPDSWKAFVEADDSGGIPDLG